jgi:hypothetical protein
MSLQISPFSSFCESEQNFFYSADQSKTISYVVGEKVLQPLIEKGSRFFSSSFKLIKQFWNSLLTLNFPVVSAQEIISNSCYVDILSKYSPLAVCEAAKGLVHVLCDNQVTEYTVESGVFEAVSDITGVVKALRKNTSLKKLRIIPGSSYSADAVGDKSLPLGWSPVILAILKKIKTLDELIFNIPLREGFSEILQSLPCSNLKSLSLGIDTDRKFPGCYGVVDQSTILYLMSSVEMNPYFPLKKLAVGLFDVNHQQTDAAASAIPYFKCLHTLDFRCGSLQIDKSIVASIFRKIGESRSLAVVFFPVVSPTSTYNSEEKKIILNAVQSNPCFLKYEGVSSLYFPDDLTQEINRLLQGRVQCPPHPMCSKPQNCLENDHLSQGPFPPVDLIQHPPENGDHPSRESLPTVNVIKPLENGGSHQCSSGDRDVKLYYVAVGTSLGSFLLGIIFAYLYRKCSGGGKDEGFVEMEIQ